MVVSKGEEDVGEGFSVRVKSDSVVNGSDSAGVVSVGDEEDLIFCSSMMDGSVVNGSDSVVVVSVGEEDVICSSSMMDDSVVNGSNSNSVVVVSMVEKDVTVCSSYLIVDDS